VAKQVVFVQGGKKKEEAFPWMFFHFDPFTDVDPGTVDLVYFDYPAGKLKTWKNWNKKRGKAPAAAPDSEVELLPKVKLRLEDGTLDTGPDKPSVLAFYDFMQNQPKGSIVSLQIFSHGWMGGPIIWDTFEFGPAGEDISADDTLDRDAHDTDFRIRDFFGKNPLAGAGGRKFAEAFAPDALIKLWGCVAPEGIRSMVRNFVKAPKGSAGDATRKAHLKDYLDAVSASFAHIMARELKLSVWAAPLGWGSDPGTNIPTNRGNLKVRYSKTFPPDLKKDQWWRVSWFFRNQDRGASFYLDTLKARVDKVDFVEYKQAWFDDAMRVATASAAPGLIPSPRDLQQALLDQIDLMGESVQPIFRQ
jgi:hypothetical protein